MSDYAVKITVKNGRILRLMRAKGISSNAELSRLTGIPPTRLGEIINLKTPPVRKDGAWIAGVEDIAGVLGCDPEDMFSEAQMSLSLKTNTAETFMDERTVAQLTSGSFEQSAWAKIELERVLSSCTDREKECLLRFANGEGYSSIAEDFGISGGRVMQIVHKAMMKARIKAVNKMGAGRDMSYGTTSKKLRAVK